MLAEVTDIDDGLATREAFELEVVRFAVDEQKRCGTAAAVCLELMAVHSDDLTGSGPGASSNPSSWSFATSLGSSTTDQGA